MPMPTQINHRARDNARIIAQTPSQGTTYHARRRLYNDRTSHTGYHKTLCGYGQPKIGTGGPALGTGEQ